MPSFTLLNTRPAHQATELNNLIVGLGGKVISCPTIDIEWLEPTGSDIQHISRFDKVIFTSPNAIEGWVKCLNEPMSQSDLLALSCYAIGKGTKLKGQTVGLNIATLSDKQFDSEHFLAHPNMQKVEGLKIALIKGRGGLDLIKNTLTQRGASVTQLEVYQRKPVAFCNQAWTNFLASLKPILLITSMASWQALLTGLNQMLNDAESVTDFLNQVCGLVVMSQRIADEIASSGCTVPIKVVTTQSNEGIVLAIQQCV